MNGYERMTDDELYGSFLQGDTTAYDQLMIRYGDALLLYLSGYLHDWHEAEDHMIEAFARIMAKRPSIGEGNFKAYLFRTGRNLALRFFERRSRMQTFSVESMEVDLPDEASVAQNLLRSERQQTLSRCIDRIESELREALWLVYVDELSYAQAASVMGVKVKRIDRLLYRGKQQMRIELAKEGITNAYE